MHFSYSAIVSFFRVWCPKLDTVPAEASMPSKQD